MSASEIDADTAPLTAPTTLSEISQDIIWLGDNYSDECYDNEVAARTQNCVAYFNSYGFTLSGVNENGIARSAFSLSNFFSGTSGYPDRNALSEYNSAINNYKKYCIENDKIETGAVHRVVDNCKDALNNLKSINHMRTIKNYLDAKENGEEIDPKLKVKAAYSAWKELSHAFEHVK